nr:basic proline-rich protein-like [Aegilops tauschii subsp. strangulata]
MTRARARAIENEVNSFLFELHSNSHESWVLPQTEILCIFRYEEDDRGETKTETQAPKEKKEEENHGKGQGEVALGTPGTRTPLPPGAPAFGRALDQSLATPGARPEPGSRLSQPRVPGPSTPGARPLPPATSSRPGAQPQPPSRQPLPRVPGPKSPGCPVPPPPGP